MKAWVLMLVSGFILSGCAMVGETGKNVEANRCRRKHTATMITAPIDLHVSGQINKRGHGTKR